MTAPLALHPNVRIGPRSPAASSARPEATCAAAPEAPNPNDTIDALVWAIGHLREHASDPLNRQRLRVLEQLRENSQRDARATANFGARPSA